jgi:hypothetical protein
LTMRLPPVPWTWLISRLGSSERIKKGSIGYGMVIFKVGLGPVGTIHQIGNIVRHEASALMRNRTCSLLPESVCQY